MASIGQSGPVHAHYFRVPRRRRPGGHGPGDEPHDYSLLWRLAALALIPLLAWILTEALHERIPQTAGGLRYDVVVNKLTGSACIEVKGEETPESLADLSCK